MTSDVKNKRLVLSSYLNKKDHECKRSDKKWMLVTNKLDVNQESKPKKNDFLNKLGCTVESERKELIKHINSFFDFN